MPNIGDITTASKIGYRGRAKFVWIACPDCGIERWRPLSSEVTRCWKCSANHRERERKPLTFSGVGVPKVGDTARASTVGQAGRAIHVYASCPSCGAKRWTRTRYENSPCPLCTAKIYNSKSGGQHPRWRGGIKRTRGYVYVLLPKEDPFSVMGTKRYHGQAVVAEHRLVMARAIGRPLSKSEIVHHVNGVKNDNRIENLRLLNEHEHHSSLVMWELQARLVSHEARLTVLEAENVLLKSVLQEVRDSIPEAMRNLRCYNTLSSLLDTQIEGIVRASSNGGEDMNRSCCIRRSLRLRPLSVMTLKNPAKSVEPKSDVGYGNAELGNTCEKEFPSVETLHGTPFGVKTKSDSHRKVSQIGSTPLSPTSNNGVPVRQLTGKLVANSGNPKREYPHGNPELNGGVNAS